ncbi:MAG: TIGR00341 family protein [Melioribacteraceae bacterium]|nr:TIGR00341 family protein [Melioribacteraceae bacterium]
MIYVVLNLNDKETFDKDFLPFFGEIEFQLISYDKINEIKFETDKDILVTYLDDNSLIEFLPKAAEKKCAVGILPHAEMDYIANGLGVSSDPETAVQEILDYSENHKVDLLFCNGKPVFKSVNIGKVFELIESGSSQNFYTQLFNFLKRIWKSRNLKHVSYSISKDGEELIETSALGIISVEHAHSSLVSRRLVVDSSINDGFLHVLILAPQNIFEMIRFLFRSLLPAKNTIKSIPSFIGYIKSSNLKIKCASPIDFSIDGEKFTADEISFEIKHESLYLAQASIFEKESDVNRNKEKLKIEKLPRGEKKEELIKRKLPLLPRATSEEFIELFKILRENSILTLPYSIMMILSTLIATFGLYADSSPVIIGAMILAPLMAPIVSFSMGVVRYDVNMLRNSIITILVGTIVSLLFAAIVSIMTPLRIITPEIGARLSPNLLDLGIAVASGVAAAYAHSKESIAKSLAGVAIAVALVPPLAVAGIGIGWLDWEVFSGAFLLYLTNLAGIIMFGGLTFLVLGFAPFKRAKKGLLYTLIIILLVCIPLTFSFNSIMQEAELTRMLEGTKIEEVTLRDVKVRFGSPLFVSAKLTSSGFLSDNRIKEIKTEIEKIVGDKIRLEVITAVGLE